MFSNINSLFYHYQNFNIFQLSYRKVKLWLKFNLWRQSVANYFIIFAAFTFFRQNFQSATYNKSDIKLCKNGGLVGFYIISKTQTQKHFGLRPNAMSLSALRLPPKWRLGHDNNETCCPSNKSLIHSSVKCNKLLTWSNTHLMLHLSGPVTRHLRFLGTISPVQLEGVAIRGECNLIIWNHVALSLAHLELGTGPSAWCSKQPIRLRSPTGWVSLLLSAGAIMAVSGIEIYNQQVNFV